jgi:hypothetical protein
MKLHFRLVNALMKEAEHSKKNACSSLSLLLQALESAEIDPKGIRHGIASAFTDPLSARLIKIVDSEEK